MTNITEFEMKLQLAESNGKAGLIDFLKEIEIIQIKPWVEEWVEKYFNDQMAKVFWHRWSGTVDLDVLDEIEAVMLAA